MGILDCFRSAAILTKEQELRAHLLRVSGIVQAETPHCPDMLGSQRCKEQTNVGDSIRHIVLAKDVALHDAGLAGLADVGNTAGKDCVAVVGTAIPGQETDKALGRTSASSLLFWVSRHDVNSLKRQALL